MGGEWLAWVDVANGDAAWEAMAGAFLEGAIPHCTSARIGISEAKNMYVICVTTADYTDLAVRPTLRPCISKLSAVKPNVLGPPQDVKASYDELHALGLLAEAESGYRIEVLNYTGLCASHDGDSWSATRNGMELCLYRTQNLSNQGEVDKLQGILQKGSFERTAARPCPHYGRNSCRFKGNCWVRLHPPRSVFRVHGSDSAGVVSGRVCTRPTAARSARSPHHHRIRVPLPNLAPSRRRRVRGIRCRRRRVRGMRVR